MPNKSNFKRLLLDGFPYQADSTGVRFDDPLTLLVSQLVRELRLGLTSEVLTGKQADLDQGCLVLLSWSENHNQLHLDRIVSTGAEVVAQIPEDCPVAPETVAKYLGNGLLYCFNRASFLQKEGNVRNCLRDVLKGAPPFGKFRWVTAKGQSRDRPKKIFLSRPNARQELRGIASVLSGLGIDYLDPLVSGGGGSVNHSVRTDIDNCDGVIGHFGQRFGNDQDGRELVSYNANVMYELGYASKAEKPMVLFGDERDQKRWPADLQGFVVGTFEDAVEIVQRVHYGLAI